MRCPYGFYDQGVTVLSGMLTVNSVAVEEINNYDLWVMKEYGIKESWTKLFTLRIVQIGYKTF